MKSSDCEAFNIDLDETIRKTQERIERHLEDAKTLGDMLATMLDARERYLREGSYIGDPAGENHARAA